MFTLPFSTAGDLRNLDWLLILQSLVKRFILPFETAVVSQEAAPAQNDLPPGFGRSGQQ
jgi:hypothetical protein